MLKELDLGAVSHGLSVVDLHGAGGIDSHVAVDGISVAEKILSVLVGQLAVAHEGAVVVLGDQSLVLLDERSGQVCISLVLHDLAFGQEQLGAVLGDIGSV